MVQYKHNGKYLSKVEYIRIKRLELYGKKKAKVSKGSNRIPKKKKSKQPKIVVRRQFGTYKEYLLSPEWKKIRKRILKRANYKCEICGMKAYQVHHKTYKRIFKERDTDLIAICGTCHQDKHKILTDEQVEKRVNELMELEGYK